MQELTINNWKILSNPGNLVGEWITADEIGTHLGYEEPRKSINNMYNRNPDFFKDGIDTAVIKLVTPSGTQDSRIFSERGVLKIMRYSKTELADSVMEEVIDVFLAARKKSSSCSTIDARMKKHENHPLVMMSRKMDEMKQQHDEIIIAFVEIEERQKQIENKQQEQAKQIADVKAKTSAILSQSDYYSIMAWAKLIGEKIDLQGAARIGRLATKVSNDMRINVGKIPDPRHGEVNIYHREVLENVLPKRNPVDIVDHLFRDMEN